MGLMTARCGDVGYPWAQEVSRSTIQARQQDVRRVERHQMKTGLDSVEPCSCRLLLLCRQSYVDGFEPAPESINLLQPLVCQQA